MFLMLSSFNLRAGESERSCQQAINEFDRCMREAKLLHSVGPLGKRVSNTPMDTDDDRALQYYFLSYFDTREQCDKAYDLIEQGVEPNKSIHQTMIRKVSDAVFTCWEEIDFQQQYGIADRWKHQIPVVESVMTLPFPSKTSGTTFSSRQSVCLLKANRAYLNSSRRR